MEARAALGLVHSTQRLYTAHSESTQHSKSTQRSGSRAQSQHRALAVLSVRALSVLSCRGFEGACHMVTSVVWCGVIGVQSRLQLKGRLPAIGLGIFYAVDFLAVCSVGGNAQYTQLHAATQNCTVI